MVVGKPEMIPTLQLQLLSQVVRLAVLELRLLPLWSNINVNSGLNVVLWELATSFDTFQSL